MSRVILGVSPNAPIEENKQGGKQSSLPYDFTPLPTAAVFEAAKVVKQGAEKYGEDFSNRNYTKIPTISHINHAISHLYSYLAGDTSDEHLAHALVRVMFAVDCDKRDHEDASPDDF